jgi:hypothetical protein
MQRVFQQYSWLTGFFGAKTIQLFFSLFKKEYSKNEVT